jgi:putative FmdB family regulatory protein
MPIYEYACAECGHEFELIQKITDAPRRKCPACGRLKARRAVSHTSFVLKGAGWYATEYGNRKAAKSIKADKADKADAPAAAETPAPAKKEPAPQAAGS